MKHGISATSILLFTILAGLIVLVTSCTEPPIASYTTDKATVVAGEAVQFSNTSTGEIVSRSWDFGDGNTSTEDNTSHAYVEKGIYTASLTVSNKSGSDTATLTITVLKPLKANFSASKTTASLDSAIQFTDESSGDIDSWSWDFGDGNSSTEQNPLHTYEDAGTYTVSLMVSNTVSSDTSEKKGYITMTEVSEIPIPEPERKELLVQWVRAQYSGQRYEFEGSVKNVGTVPLIDVQVEQFLFDADHTLVRVESTYLDPSTIAVGELAHFNYKFMEIKQIKSYDFRFTLPSGEEILFFIE